MLVERSIGESLITTLIFLTIHSLIKLSHKKRVISEINRRGTKNIIVFLNGGLKMK